MRSYLRIALGSICVAGLASNQVQAAEKTNTEDDGYVSAMRYVALDGQRDNADSSQYSATGSFTLGKYVWLQGTLGKLLNDTSNGLGDLKNVGLGTGVKNEHWQFTVNFSHYKNDASYKQRDIAAALDWQDKRFTVGLDASHRNTDNAYDYSFTDTYPTLGVTTIATHTNESLSGNGFGAHASWYVTDRLNLALGGMGYSYNQKLDVTTRVTSAQPQPISQLIAQLLQRRINLNIQTALATRSDSVVTRSVVPLHNSYDLAASYYFDKASLSAQYIRDKVLSTNGHTNTLIVGAALSLGDQWTLAPQLGRSSSDDNPDVTFAGLSLSYNW